MAASDRNPAPTMNEVARRAGVALSSVSRVMNGHPDVSPQMRSRVLEAMSELGYERNLLAAGLRRGRSHTIGFIVTDIANPLFAAVLNSAQAALGRRDYSAIVANSNGDPGQEVELARLLRQRRADALVVSLSDEGRPEIVRELLRLDGPVVLLDRQTPELEGRASVVESDHDSGMRRAVRHLLNLGHRRTALLAGPPGVRPTVRRIQSCREAFAAAGEEFPGELVRSGSFTPKFGEAAAAELLNLPEPPTAFISGGNRILVGLMRALRRRGLLPGRDISVVSCDDVPLSELYTPPITVINRDMRQMGQAAAELALERIDDPARPPRTIVLPTHLVLRESTSRVP